MAMIELCEPLLQYLCRVNRSARKGLPMDTAQVRGDVKQLLSELQTKAQKADEGEQATRIKRPLHWLIDAVVIGAGGPTGAQWKNMRLEPEDDGGESFFAEVEKDLADPGDAATERLAVYYHCIGLGFVGKHAEDTDMLRRVMAKMQARLRGTVEVDKTARMCPEAYEKVNTANLIEPPSRSMVPIVIALVGTLLVLAAANVFFYRSSSQELSRALTDITGSLGGGGSSDGGSGESAAGGASGR